MINTETRFKAEGRRQKAEGGKEGKRGEPQRTVCTSRGTRPCNCPLQRAASAIGAKPAGSRLLYEKAYAYVQVAAPFYGDRTRQK